MIIVFLSILFLTIFLLILIKVYSIYTNTDTYEDFNYTPDIDEGDTVKLVSDKESPSMLEKEFYVIKISNNGIVVLESYNGILLKRNINEIEKVYKK